MIKRNMWFIKDKLFHHYFKQVTEEPHGLDGIMITLDNKYKVHLPESYLQDNEVMDVDVITYLQCEFDRLKEI